MSKPIQGFLSLSINIQKNSSYNHKSWNCLPTLKFNWLKESTHLCKGKIHIIIYKRKILDRTKIFHYYLQSRSIETRHLLSQLGFFFLKFDRRLLVSGTYTASRSESSESYSTASATCSVKKQLKREWKKVNRRDILMIKFKTQLNKR